MASQYIVDTPIKLGQCNRCQGWVFLAMSSGIRSAADPAPVDRAGYIAAITEGRRLFDLFETAGRPQKLLTRSLGAPSPLWGPSGAQEAAQGRRKVLREHGCGGHQRNMLTFKEVEQGPRPAPAMPGERRGGNHQPDVHDSKAVLLSPVESVNPRHSEPYPKCGTCSKYIKPGELYWGIQHGPTWIYCEHEDCP